MIITNIELKQTTTNKTYKCVYFGEKAYGKDRTNVFDAHPMYHSLVIGMDIPLDQLEVNQKGYLELKGNKSPSPSAPTVNNEKERAMRMEALLQNINTKVNELYKHAGIDKTPAYPEYTGAPNFGEEDYNGRLPEEGIPF